MADDPKEGGGDGEADGGLGDRVSKLEAGQDTLAGKLDQVIGMLSGGGEGGGGHAPEGSGGSPAADIRAALDERDRRKAAEDKERATSDRLGALETSLTELKEKPPGPLPRRVEKLMGWT